MAAQRLAPVLALLMLITQLPAAESQTADSSPPSDTIRYTVSFPAPHTHYMEVSADIPTDGRQDVELMMAVWTPGSYLVREYARNVEAVRAAASGRALEVEKTDKNRWRVATGGAPVVTVSYRVYAREMSVRTNWVEAGFALINGAPTFMTVAGGGARPHEVRLELPSTWRRSATALRELPNGPHRYAAADFDTLVDSPILVGNHSVYEFTVDGIPHSLVNEGEAGVFDGARAARDFETLVRAHQRFWGTLPYEKYVLLNVLTESRGGLEHKDSAVVMASRWATGTRGAYVQWLSLVSHEIFHAWNGKRLRPVELGPFDYEDEAHTRSLWIVEGITDYYADLLTHRAGLMTRDELLGNLSAMVEEIQTSPGRHIQSVELASFDAWIKFYRPDENSPNASISYYSKGTLLALLLDARIRQTSGGTRSLDDVMRAAYARYSGPRGFTADEFRAVAEQVAGGSLGDFWRAAVQGTEELDYTPALAAYGLRFRPASVSGRPSLGASTRTDQGRLVVSEVRRDGPASAAGLNVDDEIIAIGDFRVRPEQLTNRLAQYRAGERVSLLVARRDQLLRLDVTLGAESARSWHLEVDFGATTAQRAQLERWLSP